MHTLRILFPEPGFFLSDARLVIGLNGESLHDGSFKNGFETEVQLSAGTHQLSTRIQMGPLSRQRTYTLEIGDSARYTATLRYSRFWGNFTRKLRLDRSSAPAPITPS